MEPANLTKKQMNKILELTNSEIKNIKSTKISQKEKTL